MKVSGFLVLNSDGEEIEADPYGNNIAFTCGNCSHPILAIAMENQRGSDEEHPVKCIGCGEDYFIDVRQKAEKIYIFKID